MTRTFMITTCLATMLGVQAHAQTTPEENEALVRMHYEQVINEGRFELLDEIVTEDFIQHNEGNGQADDTMDAGSGRETLRGYLTTLRQEIPDFSLEIRDVVSADDRVAVYSVGSGTHTGMFFGMPATGQPFTYATMDIFRVEDGMLAEHWDTVDRLGLMQRIGLIPLAGTGAQDEAGRGE